MDTEVLQRPTETKQAPNKKQNLEIRAARQDDKGDIAALMYSSGADLYDYVYNTKDKHALEFIQQEFLSRRGLCSHKLLTVAVDNNQVVATGTFWNREQYLKMSNGSTLNMIKFYGFKVLPRMQRAMDSMKLMRPPKPGELYLANFGVAPELRGQGIGSKLLKHKIAEAKQQGYNTVALDVSNKNPQAEALYSRLGFAVTKAKRMVGRDGNTYAGKKMELFL